MEFENGNYAIGNRSLSAGMESLSVPNQCCVLAATPDESITSKVPDPKKSQMMKVEDGLQKSLSDDARSRVSKILTDTEKLSDVEKLLLYLKLPTGKSGDYPASQKTPSHGCPPNSECVRHNQAFVWIKSHLELDRTVCLLKQEVYDEYRLYCESQDMVPLTQPDFGKIMKNVFPNVKIRRLGQRGQSRYCYSGMWKTSEVAQPSLPSLDISTIKSEDECAKSELFSSACELVCEFAQKLFSHRFSSITDLAEYLLENHYVDARSLVAFKTIIAMQEATGAKPKVPLSALLGGTASSRNKHEDAKQQVQRILQKREILKELRHTVSKMKADTSASITAAPHQRRQKAASAVTLSMTSPTVLNRSNSPVIHPDSTSTTNMISSIPPPPPLVSDIQPLSSTPIHSNAPSFSSDFSQTTPISNCSDMQAFIPPVMVRNLCVPDSACQSPSPLLPDVDQASNNGKSFMAPTPPRRIRKLSIGAEPNRDSIGSHDTVFLHPSFNRSYECSSTEPVESGLNNTVEMLDDTVTGTAPLQDMQRVANLSDHSGDNTMTISAHRVTPSQHNDSDASMCQAFNHITVNSMDKSTDDSLLSRTIVPSEHGNKVIVATEDSANVLMNIVPINCDINEVARPSETVNSTAHNSPVPFQVVPVGTTATVTVSYQTEPTSSSLSTLSTLSTIPVSSQEPITMAKSAFVPFQQQMLLSGRLVYPTPARISNGLHISSISSSSPANSQPPSISSESQSVYHIKPVTTLSQTIVTLANSDQIFLNVGTIAAPSSTLPRFSISAGAQTAPQGIPLSVSLSPCILTTTTTAVHSSISVSCPESPAKLTSQVPIFPSPSRFAVPKPTIPSIRQKALSVCQTTTPFGDQPSKDPAQSPSLAKARPSRRRSSDDAPSSKDLTKNPSNLKIMPNSMHNINSQSRVITPTKTLIKQQITASSFTPSHMPKKAKSRFVPVRSKGLHPGYYSSMFGPNFASSLSTSQGRTISEILKEKTQRESLASQAVVGSKLMPVGNALTPVNSSHIVLQEPTSVNLPISPASGINFPNLPSFITGPQGKEFIIIVGPPPGLIAGSGCPVSATATSNSAPSLPSTILGTGQSTVMPNTFVVQPSVSANSIMLQKSFATTCTSSAISLPILSNDSYLGTSMVNIPVMLPNLTAQQTITKSTPGQPISHVSHNLSHGVTPHLPTIPVSSALATKPSIAVPSSYITTLPEIALSSVSLTPLVTIPSNVTFTTTDSSSSLKPSNMFTPLTGQDSTANISALIPASTLSTAVCSSTTLLAQSIASTTFVNSTPSLAQNHNMPTGTSAFGNPCISTYMACSGEPSFNSGIDIMAGVSSRSLSLPVDVNNGKTTLLDTKQTSSDPELLWHSIDFVPNDTQVSLSSATNPVTVLHSESFNTNLSIQSTPMRNVLSSNIVSQDGNVSQSAFVVSEPSLVTKVPPIDFAQEQQLLPKWQEQQDKQQQKQNQEQQHHQQQQHIMDSINIPSSTDLQHPPHTSNRSQSGFIAFDQRNRSFQSMSSSSIGSRERKRKTPDSSKSLSTTCSFELDDVEPASPIELLTERHKRDSDEIIMIDSCLVVEPDIDKSDDEICAKRSKSCVPDTEFGFPSVTQAEASPVLQHNLQCPSPDFLSSLERDALNESTTCLATNELLHALTHGSYQVGFQVQQMMKSTSVSATSKSFNEFERFKKQSKQLSHRIDTFLKQKEAKDREMVTDDTPDVAASFMDFEVATTNSELAMLQIDKITQEQNTGTSLPGLPVSGQLVIPVSSNSYNVEEINRTAPFPDPGSSFNNFTKTTACSVAATSTITAKHIPKGYTSNKLLTQLLTAGVKKPRAKSSSTAPTSDVKQTERSVSFDGNLVQSNENTMRQQFVPSVQATTAASVQENTASLIPQLENDLPTDVAEFITEALEKRSLQTPTLTTDTLYTALSQEGTNFMILATDNSKNNVSPKHNSPCHQISALSSNFSENSTNPSVLTTETTTSIKPLSLHSHSDTRHTSIASVRSPAINLDNSTSDGTFIIPKAPAVKVPLQKQTDSRSTSVPLFNQSPVVQVLIAGAYAEGICNTPLAGKNPFLPGIRRQVSQASSSGYYSSIESSPITADDTCISKDSQRVTECTPLSTDKNCTLEVSSTAGCNLENDRSPRGLEQISGSKMDDFHQMNVDDPFSNDLVSEKVQSYNSSSDQSKNPDLLSKQEENASTIYFQNEPVSQCVSEQDDVIEIQTQNDPQALTTHYPFSYQLSLLGNKSSLEFHKDPSCSTEKQLKHGHSEMLVFSPDQVRKVTQVPVSSVTNDVKISPESVTLVKHFPSSKVSGVAKKHHIVELSIADRLQNILPNIALPLSTDCDGAAAVNSIQKLNLPNSSYVGRTPNVNIQQILQDKNISDPSEFGILASKEPPHPREVKNIQRTLALVEQLVKAQQNQSIGSNMDVFHNLESYQIDPVHHFKTSLQRKGSKSPSSTQHTIHNMTNPQLFSKADQKDESPVRRNLIGVLYSVDDNLKKTKENSFEDQFQSKVSDISPHDSDPFCSDQNL